MNQKYEVNVDRAINTIELGEKYFIKVDNPDPTEVVVNGGNPLWILRLIRYAHRNRS
jgi:hypothetical protein